MHLKHKIKSLDEYNAKLEGLIRVFEENGVIQRTNNNNDDDKFETMQISTENNFKLRWCQIKSISINFNHFVLMHFWLTLRKPIKNEIRKFVKWYLQLNC